MTGLTVWGGQPGKGSDHSAVAT